jgi:hypothetical protein
VNKHGMFSRRWPCSSADRLGMKSVVVRVVARVVIVVVVEGSGGSVGSMATVDVVDVTNRLLGVLYSPVTIECRRNKDECS